MRQTEETMKKTKRHKHVGGAGPVGFCKVDGCNASYWQGKWTVKGNKKG